ncbi:MAG: hypothetical protein ABI702_19855 [Burkholderiales bacterium]
MRSALTALLDGVAGSRKVLRHLAAVEHDLDHKDGQGRFLSNATAERLRIVLRQLDGLLGQTPPSGLVALRGCLTDAIRMHERAEIQAAAKNPASSFFGDHTPEVSEGCASDFDRIQAEWNPTQPADL